MSAISRKPVRSLSATPSSAANKSMESYSKGALSHDTHVHGNSRLNPSDYIPKRFGLRYDPSTISNVLLPKKLLLMVPKL